jgi:hypothetical protein
MIEEKSSHAQNSVYGINVRVTHLKPDHISKTELIKIAKDERQTN